MSRLVENGYGLGIPTLDEMKKSSDRCSMLVQVETLNVEPLLELMIGRSASAALSGSTLWHKLIGLVDTFKKQQSVSLSAAMCSSSSFPQYKSDVDINTLFIPAGAVSTCFSTLAKQLLPAWVLPKDKTEKKKFLSHLSNRVANWHVGNKLLEKYSDLPQPTESLKSIEPRHHIDNTTLSDASIHLTHFVVMYLLHAFRNITKMGISPIGNISRFYCLRTYNLAKAGGLFADSAEDSSKEEPKPSPQAKKSLKRKFSTSSEDSNKAPKQKKKIIKTEPTPAKKKRAAASSSSSSDSSDDEPAKPATPKTTITPKQATPSRVVNKNQDRSTHESVKPQEIVGTPAQDIVNLDDSDDPAATSSHKFDMRKVKKEKKDNEPVYDPEKVKVEKSLSNGMDAAAMQRAETSSRVSSEAVRVERDTTDEMGRTMADIEELVTDVKQDPLMQPSYKLVFKLMASLCRKMYNNSRAVQSKLDLMQLDYRCLEAENEKLKHQLKNAH